MNDNYLKTLTKIIVPFILLLGFYIQIHGENSPGGGFQAGAIIASAFILYGMCFGIESLKKIISIQLLKFLASFGVIIYLSLGIVSIVMGGNYLDYNVLASDKLVGQKIGIFIIEIGIGFTVFSSIMLFFIKFEDY